MDDSDKNDQCLFFRGLYIEKYTDVTILYADIVNYTKMTSTVPVKMLVEILNELFGKFDDASEVNHLQRDTGVRFYTNSFCSQKNC